MCYKGTALYFKSSSDLFCYVVMCYAVKWCSFFVGFINFRSEILGILLCQPRHEKTCLWGFATRLDSNGSAQP